MSSYTFKYLTEVECHTQSLSAEYIVLRSCHQIIKINQNYYTVKPVNVDYMCKACIVNYGYVNQLRC